MSGRRARTEELAEEIRGRGLTYDEIQALWHVVSWHLVYEAKNVSPTAVVYRMVKALSRLPRVDLVVEREQMAEADASDGQQSGQQAS